MRDIRGNGLPRATRAPKVTTAIAIAPSAVSIENRAASRPCRRRGAFVARITPRYRDGAAILSDDVEPVIYPLVQRAKFLSKHGHVTPGRHGL